MQFCIVLEDVQQHKDDLPELASGENDVPQVNQESLAHPLKKPEDNVPTIDPGSLAHPLKKPRILYPLSQESGAYQKVKTPPLSACRDATKEDKVLNASQLRGQAKESVVNLDDSRSFMVS